MGLSTSTSDVLASAQAAVRAKEIGIRKVTGAHRSQIFEQFLSESFFTTALASGLALGLIVLALPRFDELFGISIKPQLLGFNSLWPWLAATVVFQFTASVALIMATIVVFSQMKYVKSDFDTGYIDENFLDVFEIGLVSGRNFRAGDKNVMLMNEAALNELGWKEPIGKKFRGGPTEIVGIIKDFQNGSLHKKIGPMTLFYGSGRRQIAVRVRPGDITKTIGVLRAVFEQNNPGQPFDFYFLDDIYNALYKKEIRTGRIFGSFAVLAALLACLGLLGLSSFTVSRRTHEIGIRKIMGASVSRLVFLLSRDFVKPVIIANMIAWPLAFYSMNRWLQDFVYRINIRPWIFVLSSILSLAGALLVAGWKTLKAARMNPADILRHE